MPDVIKPRPRIFFVLSRSAWQKKRKPDVPTPPYFGALLAPQIKHDSFRILARRDDARVRLYTRNGYDFTTRFPKNAATVESLRVRSRVLDGEAILVDERGLSLFEALRYRTHDHAAVLCAFERRAGELPNSLSSPTRRSPRPFELLGCGLMILLTRSTRRRG